VVCSYYKKAKLWSGVDSQPAGPCSRLKRKCMARVTWNTSYLGDKRIGEEIVFGGPEIWARIPGCVTVAKKVTPRRFLGCSSHKAATLRDKKMPGHTGTIGCVGKIGKLRE